MASLKLTEVERLILLNQYKILKAIEPDGDDVEHYDEAMEILRSGYESEYRELASMFTSVSGDDCDFVYRVLAMYSAITYCRRGTADAKANAPFARFAGFDGNNEAALLGFARFLFKSERYPEVAEGSETDGFNSHMPTRQIYERMLTVYDKVKDAIELTEEQVVLIIQAADTSAQRGRR